MVVMKASVDTDGQQWSDRKVRYEIRSSAVQAEIHQEASVFHIFIYV